MIRDDDEDFVDPADLGLSDDDEPIDDVDAFLAALMAQILPPLH